MGRNAQKRRAAAAASRNPEPPVTPKPQNTTPPLPPIPGMKMAAGDGIVTYIRGKVPIAFLEETMDCCSEKMIMEYGPYFGQENMACLLIPKPAHTDILKYLAKNVVLFRLGNADCSPEDTKKVLNYLMYIKNMGVRLVYYADDLIFWSNNQTPIGYLKLCDAAIVSNIYLKKVLVEMLKYPHPVIVVPTHIALEYYDGLPLLTNVLSDRFKVLMTSGGRIGTNLVYEICELANTDPELCSKVEWIFNCNGVAQIRSIINKFRNLKKTYFDWMASAHYYSLTKSVNCIMHPASPEDLNYMCPPEMQQPWLDCKSEVKYTLAGAAKIPIISSPTASYRDAIQHEKTGYLAVTAQEFIDRIRQLANDRGLCKEIGWNARKHVEENYNIKQRYPLYRDAILGKLDKVSQDSISIRSDRKYMYVPPVEGGPRTFYENMKRFIPSVSSGKWEVTNNLREADVALAVAFIAYQELLEERKTRPDLKIIYRLDGLPMETQSNELNQTNLKMMVDMFYHANVIVWQSKHCQKMWTERNLLPKDISTEGPIIPNGVDLQAFCPEGMKYMLPKAKQYNYLNMNWSTFHHKRLDLLQDFIKAYDGAPDVLFYLIGNYVGTNQLANLTYWKDRTNVVYLGQMRNQSVEAKKMLSSIYRAVNGLIFTSEMEGSPNTVLEALGSLCPVIYNTRSDIVPEILEDACIPLEEFESSKNPEVISRIQKKMMLLRSKYSMEECVKKYLAVAESL